MYFRKTMFATLAAAVLVTAAAFAANTPTVPKPGTAMPGAPNASTNPNATQPDLNPYGDKRTFAQKVAACNAVKATCRKQCGVPEAKADICSKPCTGPTTELCKAMKLKACGAGISLTAMIGGMPSCEAVCVARDGAVCDEVDAAFADLKKAANMKVLH